jgi:outer membrane protein assembly factor BamB
MVTTMNYKYFIILCTLFCIVFCADMSFASNSDNVVNFRGNMYRDGSYGNITFHGIKELSWTYSGNDHCEHRISSIDLRSNFSPIYNNKRVYYINGSNFWFQGRAYCILTLHSIDIHSGKKIWTLNFDTGNKKLGKYLLNDRTLYEPEFSLYFAPLYHAGTIYYGTFDGFLIAVDANKGSELWRYNAGSRIVSSPVAVGNHIIFGTMDGKVLSVNSKRGRLNWKTPTLWGSLSRIRLTLKNDVLYVLAGDIFSININNGSIIWTYNTPNYIESNFLLYNDSKIYWPSGSDIHAIDINNPNRPLWKTSGLKSNLALYKETLIQNISFLYNSRVQVRAINVLSGDIIWENKVSTQDFRDIYDVTEPVISGNYVYFYVRGKNPRHSIVGLNLYSGNIEWEYVIDNYIPEEWGVGNYFFNLSIFDEYFLLSNENGILLGFKGFSEKATHDRLDSMPLNGNSYDSIFDEEDRINKMIDASIVIGMHAGHYGNLSVAINNISMQHEDERNIYISRVYAFVSLVNASSLLSSSREMNSSSLLPDDVVEALNKQIHHIDALIYYTGSNFFSWNIEKIQEEYANIKFKIEARANIYHKNILSDN